MMKKRSIYGHRDKRIGRSRGVYYRKPISVEVVDEDDIPSFVKRMSDAATMHGKTVERLWVLCFTLAVIALFGFDSSNEERVNILGVAMDKKIFRISVALLILFVNYPFSGAYVRLSECLSAIDDYLKYKNISEKKIFVDNQNNTDVNLKMVSHYLVKIHLQTIAPINHVFRKRFQSDKENLRLVHKWRFYHWLLLTSLFIYFPVYASLTVWFFYTKEVFQIDCNAIYYQIASLVFVPIFAISLIPTSAVFLIWNQWRHRIIKDAEDALEDTKDTEIEPGG